MDLLEQRPRTPLARFQAKVIPVTESGCWLWLGTVTWRGYGTWTCREVCRQEHYAHRFSWLLHRGPIPKGLNVLHRCDLPCCVNPRHLFLGTHADNTADMMAKGRHRYNPDVRGAANPRAKLNADAVSYILASKETGLALAERYGVTPTTIYFVRQGRTWR